MPPAMPPAMLRFNPLEVLGWEEEILFEGWGDVWRVDLAGGGEVGILVGLGWKGVGRS